MSIFYLVIIYVAHSSVSDIYLCFNNAANDYVNGPFQVYFKPNETSKTLPLATIQDDVFEPDETFLLILQVPDEFARLGISIDSVNGNATIRIINDDSKLLITRSLITA